MCQERLNKFINMGEFLFCATTTRSDILVIDALQSSYLPKPVDHDIVQEMMWRFWKLDHKSALAPTADAKTKSAPEYVARFVDAKTLELFCSSGNILNASLPLRQTTG